MTSDPCWKEKKTDDQAGPYFSSFFSSVSRTLHKSNPYFASPRAYSWRTNREQRRAGIFLRELSKLVVELRLELTGLPTPPHLPAGERLRLGCPGTWGRLVIGHTEAGVGPAVSLEWHKAALPDPTHQAWLRTCLLGQSHQPLRVGLQRTTALEFPLQSHGEGSTGSGQRGWSNWGPQGPATSSSAKPKGTLAGSLVGASESPLLWPSPTQSPCSLLWGVYTVAGLLEPRGLSHSGRESLQLLLAVVARSWPPWVVSPTWSPQGPA